MVRPHFPLLDFSLAVVLAAAMLVIPVFLISYFYQTLNEPDARDELPEVKAEFSAILAALRKPQGQESILAKGSNVYIGQSFPIGDGKQFLQAARMVALANHYHEPPLLANADAKSETSLLLCSDRSIYRRFEVGLRDRYIDVQILVSTKPVERCAKK